MKSAFCRHFSICKKSEWSLGFQTPGLEMLSLIRYNKVFCKEAPSLNWNKKSESAHPILEVAFLKGKGTGAREY